MTAGGERLPPYWVATIGLLAALPSVLWAFGGGALIHDDWGIAASFDHSGVVEEIIGRSTGSPARPLTALYLGVTYGAFGAYPTPHILVLAVLNAVAAVLLLMVARHFLRRDLAICVALAWTALPNRGSTRLWVAMGSAMLAMCLVLGGVLLLAKRRQVLGAITAAGAVLAYEAVTGIALGAIAALAWHARPRSPRRAVMLAMPVVGASVLIFAMSPKRNPEANRPFSNVERVISAQLGVGVFGPLARVGGVVLLIAIAVALARLLPSFRPALCTRDRCVLAGLALLALGAAPFAMAGFPFTTDGLGDRANVTAGLGTALILGGVLHWVASAGLAGRAAATATFAFLGLLNGVDLRDYRSAVDDGDVLLSRIDSDVPPFDEPLVVGPPLPNRNGVTQFITGGDLAGALRLARGDPALEARMALTSRELDTAPEPLRYDWASRRFSRR